MLPRREFLASLPRKRIAVGALIRDDHDAVCLVHPTYKESWHLPGGTVEADESPRAGCEREVLEELGLPIPLGRLLCLDWIAPSSDDADGALIMVHDGGVIDAATIAELFVPPDELHGFSFVAVDRLAEVTSERNVLRIQASLAALRDGGLAELTDGGRS